MESENPSVDADVRINYFAFWGPWQAACVEFTFRPATLRDDEWLFMLHKAAHRDLVEAAYGPWEDLEQRSVLFPQRIAAFDVTILERDGEAVASTYLGVQDSDCWLELLQVMPQHKGQGVGTRALRWIMNQATGQNRATLLQVHRKNVRAQALYEREGFRLVGETPTHYRMRRNLTPPVTALPR